MKILHLGAGNLFGGIEVNLVTLARHRDACPQLQAEYGFCFEGKVAQELRTVGVPANTFGAVRFSRPWTVLAARRRLAAHLRLHCYHAVICHESWVHAVFAPVVRKCGIKLVFWAHDRPTPNRNWIQRLAQRTPPARVIVNSQYSAGGVGDFFPTVPCQVIYCPVAPLPRTPGLTREGVRERLATPAGAIVIVQVGRWEPHKGHIKHLEALANLAQIPDWVCWQVGQPQLPIEQAYQDEVRTTADRLGIADRVKFLGWQPDLGDILAASDVYCQPNIRSEPFGISIVEALYSGLPVVASDEAGPAEIITPNCGCLIPPGDVTSLTAALKILLHEPDRRQMLGNEGKSRAAELCDPAQQLQRLAAWLS